MSDRNRAIRLRRKQNALMLTRRQEDSNDLGASVSGVLRRASSHDGNLPDPESAAKKETYETFDGYLKGIYDALEMNDDDIKREDIVRLMLTENEKKLLAAAALASGERVASWARRQLIRVAKRSLRGAK